MSVDETDNDPKIRLADGYSRRWPPQDERPGSLACRTYWVAIALGSLVAAWWKSVVSLPTRSKTACGSPLIVSLCSRTSKVSSSDDGTRLAAVGESRRLNVWDPRTGEPVLATVPSFVGGGTSVRWLPNTHTIVYGGDDGQVALYDTDASVQRGVSLPVFADAGVGDVNIATVPGRRLALLGGYRFVGQTRQGVVYPLAPSDWLAHACSIVRRDLTRDEWAAYLPGRSYRPTCNG